MRIFVHGVPDTPAMWAPLIKALGDAATPFHAPALPGFSTPIPPGFDCTKEAYAAWLVEEMEAQAGAGGQVDLVGHDWGAILVIRAACLRPDLVSSWAVSNALPEETYRWHRTARIWQTPLLGELFMALTGRKRLAKALAAAGLPEDLARHETAHWNSDMRHAILRLYRSARHVASEWTRDLDKLPANGLVFWGDDDPFVPVETAERFCSRHSVPLHRNRDTGHWAPVERPAEFARLLQDHWT